MNVCERRAAHLSAAFLLAAGISPRRRLNGTGLGQSEERKRDWSPIRGRRSRSVRSASFCVYRPVIKGARNARPRLGRRRTDDVDFPRVSPSPSRATLVFATHTAANSGKKKSYRFSPVLLSSSLSLSCSYENTVLLSRATEAHGA